MEPLTEPARAGRRLVGTMPSEAEELLEGLRTRPRTLPCKFFYDREGSRLFERITRLEEYYPSRTEKAILGRHAGELARTMKGGSLVEIGSGDCSKISILLDAVSPAWLSRLTYVPLDVSQSSLERSRRALHSRFAGLRVQPLVADFLKQLHRVTPLPRRTICFFGSTLGNLERSQADGFLAALGRILRPGERLLLGLDMVKDPAVLEDAYNDRRQVTARFNKNILRVCNRLADTDFDPDCFRHRAFYRPDRQRIEMHLVATRDQIVRSPRLNLALTIRRGESIHTENSHKFCPEHIRGFAGLGGFSIRRIYSDPRHWFCLVDYVKRARR